MKNEEQYSLLEVEERVSALERARGFTNGDDSHSLNSGLALSQNFYHLFHFYFFQSPSKESPTLI